MDRETLLSEFGPDLLYFKKWDDSEKKSSFEACINLTPESKNRFCQVVSVQLKFCWTEDHPENVPTFEITKSEGLSDFDIGKLMEFLLKEAKMLKGSEFIFELCAKCKEYLEEPLRKKMRQYADSLVSNKQKSEKWAVPLMRNAEAVATKEEKDRWPQNLTDEMDSSARVLLLKNIDGENITICKIAEQNSIIRPPRREALHKFCAEWYGYDQERSKDILVSEWKFVCTSAGPKYDWVPFVNELRNFVTQLTENAKKIDKMDSFLCPYVFVHLQETSIEPTNFNASILIGQAINENDRCCFETSFLLKDIALIAVQIVQSLKSIHSLKLGHGHLSVDSLWETKCSDFRLSDAFIFPAASDLCKHFEEITLSLSFSALTQRKFEEIQREDLLSIKPLLESLLPDDSDKNSEYGSAASDLCKHFEEITQKNFSSSAITKRKFEQQLYSEIQKEDLSSLKSLLKSFLSDDSDNNSSDDSDDNSSDDSDDNSIYASALQKFFEFCDSATSIEELADHELIHLYKPSVMEYESEDFSSDTLSFPENCRLVEDFDDFQKLGEGAFGQVYLARKKLENKNYILKIIKSKGKMERITREVKLLLELNHENVVRYYHAWFETSDIETSQDDYSSYTTTELTNISEDSDLEILFTNKTNVDSQRNAAKSDISKVISADQGEEISGNSNTLIIQMEFCEKGTLRKSIDSGTLLKNDRLTWRLFEEIRNGLHFIHEKGIIHRDIKPQNIFLDSKMTIKIGDFGLARSVLMEGTKLSSNVGTYPYTAPETETENYDAKCDVYSLGIVLFEMFYRPLPEEDERIEILAELRNDEEKTSKIEITFPNDFGREIASIPGWRFPVGTLKKLISWMIQPNPENRPKTSELLNYMYIPIFISEENDFQKNVKKELENRSSRLYHDHLVKSLSSDMSSKAQYLYDSTIIKYNGIAQFAKEKEICKFTEELRKIFHLHGFHELSGRMVVPGSLTRDSQKIGFRVLEETGYSVAVCPDLRTNFVRFCDLNSVNYTKRFSVGKILSANIGLAPNEFTECAVDIVAPTSSSRQMAKDIITLMIDLQNNLKMLPESKPILYLGHSKLLESICISNGCTDSTVLRDISNCLHDLTIGDEIFNEDTVKCLQKNAKISFSIASSIITMIEPIKSFEELKARFQNILQHETKEIKDPANIAINEISQLLADLPRDYHEKMFIVFHPGLVYYPDVFSDGLIYLSDFTLPFRNQLLRDPVFWGGRYDSYLSSKRYTGDVFTPLSAYGLDFSIEKLLRIQELTSPSFVFSILVYPITSDAEEKADGIVQELRQNGISSSVYYGYPSADALFSYCEAMEIPYVLTISSDRDEVLFYENSNLTKSSENGIYVLNEMTREDAIKKIVELKAQSLETDKSSNEKPSLSEESMTSDK